MNYEQGINYADIKRQRAKALEVAAKCTPKKPVMIARGVRGIDLHPQSKPVHINNGIRKTNTEEVIRMHLAGKTQGEIAEFYKVTKQNISYIILRYNRANGITNIKPDKESVIDKTGKHIIKIYQND